MNNPFFSVLIPAYNAAPFIEFTLQSVYQQTFSDFEIIVIDDGSVDKTYQILKAQTDKRLKIVRQDNVGVSLTRNRAIKMACGKYVALLDCDDAWTEDHLELAARFFKRYPNYVWYLAHAQRVSDVLANELTKPEKRCAQYEAINWFLEGAHIPMCSSCVILRAVLQGHDPFPVDIKMYEDNVAFSHIAMRYPMIGYLGCATAYYRIWGGSATDRFKALQYRRSGIELDALMEHQYMYASVDCPREAKLYFRFFSYSNWWGRIRSMSLIPWIDEMKKRQKVTGKWLTYWLIFFAYLSDIFYRTMGKMVRWRYNAVVRQMQCEAKKQHRFLGGVEVD